MSKQTISQELFHKVFEKNEMHVKYHSRDQEMDHPMEAMDASEPSNLPSNQAMFRTHGENIVLMNSNHHMASHLHHHPVPPSFVSYEFLEVYVNCKLKEMELQPRGDGHEMAGDSSGGRGGCGQSRSRSPFGRLGCSHVMFDVSSNVGSLIIDCDRLGLSSHSGFSSIKANVGVFRGKWQYEVMLGTKGVMQVGWATHRCRFSQEKGVGDTEDSYAYDGNRVRKWNLNTYLYGDAWFPGDVIGVALDLEAGTVDFYRNGKHLGLAFNKVRIGPGMVYFPAVSLAYNETLVANFGATPLRYPIPGYHPLEATPFADVAKADLMLTWIFNLIAEDIKISEASTGSSFMSPATHPCSSLATYLVGNIILQRLSPLLTSKYVVEACLLRKLLSLGNTQHIHGLLDLFWALLEKQQMHECLEFLAYALINGYRYSNVIIGDQCESVGGRGGDNGCPSPSASTFSTSAFFIPTSSSSSCLESTSTSSSSTSFSSPINFSCQKKYLLVFLSLTQHPNTRSYLLKHVLFDKVKFPLLLDIKPVADNDVLEKTIFPNISVYGVLSLGAGKLLRNPAIENSLTELESLHQMILDTLIFQDEMCRVMFIAKFDSFLKENSNFNPIRLAGGVTASPQMSPLPVILCFFHRLTSLIRIQYENMINVLPISFFVDPTCVSSDVTRVGGLVSHLSKTFERDISKYIETASSMNPLLKHVYILIDGLIKLYSIGAHKQLGKHCGIRETLGELSTASEELDQLDDESGDNREAVKITSCVLEKELLTRARQLAWINSTVLTSSKRADICWLLKLLLNTLDHASSSGCLFGFIPDYYIESSLNLCYAVRFYFGPSTPALSGPSSASLSYHPHLTFDQQREYDELLKQFSTFIASHFGDERVASSELRDNLAQALASLIANPETLKALESIAIESRIKMIRNLIAPYENRAWAQSNWILLRLWKGNGFAYRYTVPPNMINKLGSSLGNKDILSSLNYLKPCPSEVFQVHLRDYLTLNKNASNAFIASVLSQLNWSFSEFIGMLQEIQNAANRPEKVFIDSRQLKICCTCFDLTLALLRVLEMIVNVNPLLVTKPEGTDLILCQLCTMINQILNRITIRTGCFEYVSDLDLPGLEPVAHFPILTAVCGILIALTLKGPQDSRDIASNALVSDASFVPSNVLFLKGRSDDDVAGESSSKRSLRLPEYDEVSEEETDHLEEMITILVTRHQALENSTSAEEISDEDMCTICYANRKTAMFVPCDHRSCKSCISMHFLRYQKECFFCKAVLDRVVFTNSDEVLYPKPQRNQ